MSLKKNGIVVACEHCQCVSDDKLGSFDVLVPVSDSETGVSGTARLWCSVTAKEHRIELKEWNDVAGTPVRASAVAEGRVKNALGFVADRRICGNRHICPSKVVEIVEKQTGG